jgi:hypothetical protein
MGKVWEGNWRKRVQDRVTAKGFSSLLAWSESRPLVSYIELARELGPDDLAAVQVEELLYDEATKAGAATLHRFLRAGLARYLCEGLPPSGWDVKGTRGWSGAASGWAHWKSEVRPAYEEQAGKIWDELVARAPHGWRPTGIDDPLLVAAFESVGLG